MNLQFVTDNSGHKNAVLVPFRTWERIQKDLKELEQLRNKKTFFSELQEAIEEVKLAKEGKIKLQSAKDFLNEL